MHVTYLTQPLNMVNTTTVGSFHYYFKPWAQAHKRVRKLFLLRMPHLKTRPGPAPISRHRFLQQKNTRAPHQCSGLPCEQYFSSTEPSRRARNSTCRARHMSLPLLRFRSARRESFQSLAQKAWPPTTCLLSRELRRCNLCSAGKWRSLNPAAAATTLRDHTVPLQQAKEWLPFKAALWVQRT